MNESNILLFGVIANFLSTIIGPTDSLHMIYIIKEEVSNNITWRYYCFHLNPGFQYIVDFSSSNSKLLFTVKNTVSSNAQNNLCICIDA